MPVLNPSSNYKTLVGTVVNAGQRARTIRVRIDEMKWNKRVQKYYLEPHHLLVRDTNRSCEIGDVINLRSNWRSSKHVRHVLTKIITPFGTPLSARPPVPPISQLQNEYETYRYAKDLRQAARGREASRDRLLEYPASTIYEGLLEINGIKRGELIDAWKRTVKPYLPRKGGEEGEEVAKNVRDMHVVSPQVKALLLEMKPHVKQIVEEAVDVTPTQRKEPINGRLARQGRHLVHLHKLRGLVEQLSRVALPSTKGSGRLERIRRAFQEDIMSGGTMEQKSTESRV